MRVALLQWPLGCLACGHLGLDEIAIEGGPTAVSTGGSPGLDRVAASGGKGTGGDENLGGAPALGGVPNSSGGADSIGGTGGDVTGGTGGSFTEIPGYPCSTDCAEPFLLYRSLEIGVPGTPQQSGGGSVARSTEVVHGDGHSLAASFSGAGAIAAIDDPIRTVGEGTIYFRAWYFIPGGAVTDPLKIAAFHGASSGGSFVSAQPNGVIGVNENDGATEDNSIAGAYPEDEWFCLQADVFVSDEMGSLTARINGSVVVSLGAIDTLPGEGVARITYGIDGAGGSQGAITIYVDDIVASSEPVACN